VDEAPAESQPILDAVNKQLGFVPNLHRLMSLSPAVLSGWVGLQSALAKTLDIKTRDGIALAVSETSGCQYCLSAHSYISMNFAKMSPEEIARCREAQSEDPKRAAAVRFARKVIETRGRVSDEDFADVRGAGFSNPQILEIIGLSAQFLLTNFMNNVAQTDIDFPVAEPARTARRSLGDGGNRHLPMGAGCGPRPHTALTSLLPDGGDQPPNGEARAAGADWHQARTS
jgi:uncharacterized peroxidase-related enzyme